MERWIDVNLPPGHLKCMSLRAKRELAGLRHDDYEKKFELWLQCKMAMNEKCRRLVEDHVLVVWDAEAKQRARDEG